MKKLSIGFGILAVLLSDITCAVAAYHYCDMVWGIRYAAYSAPAWTGLLPAVPYLIGGILCAALALFFRKKGR